MDLSTITPVLQWLKWLSVYRYAWGGMLANEMNGQMFLFDTEIEGEEVLLEARPGPADRRVIHLSKTLV